MSVFFIVHFLYISATVLLKDDSIKETIYIEALMQGIKEKRKTDEIPLSPSKTGAIKSLSV